MSESIRDYIKDFVEAQVTDQHLAQIKDLLRQTGEKHSIPMTIKVSFSVDDDGQAKISAGMSTSMKVPAWDQPLKVGKGQMGLFAAEADPPAAQLVPQPVPEKPSISLRVTDAAEPPPTTQAGRLAAIQAQNDELEKRASEGGIGLSPEAKAAIKARNAEA